MLALGRSNPLKNFPLTLAAWRALPQPGAELRLFGIEPELAGDEQGVRYVTSPSDEQVNRLLNEAALFVQTSTHEGFCLPVLEAMATGCAVVCTDAHGNRDFCEHERNCLMPDPDQRSVTLAHCSDCSRTQGSASASVKPGSRPPRTIRGPIERRARALA